VLLGWLLAGRFQRGPEEALARLKRRAEEVYRASQA
jgi:hypothetical protein